MHRTLLVLALGLVPAWAAGPTPVKRGAYLVTLMGCNDCHTPMKMGDRGPEPDLARMLSGHPSALVMPPAPAFDPKDPWAWHGAVTNTAFAGPWGVSYAANLTPDTATGLGAWSEQDFVTSLRAGKHAGKGRPILPPMPWQGIGQATDEDLKAIFAFLRSIRPIANAVPDPSAPAHP
ncbi:c-type cytochrome [Mesoterricola sediminis]|uniref:Cytochrome c domain-containing protein n=1 Tax=Mesoterricola sediminis TaxID=2927980 RepID=A0AA48GVS8_9BACT|nr:c-type cytochrome [Mesoterricola sediminis]BDU78537.1 hypothetical protein METESE_34950 [Mesoterricola sediminis]